MNDTQVNAASSPGAISGWKKALLVLSVLMMGAGVAAPLVLGGRGAGEQRLATGPGTSPTDAEPGGGDVTGVARSFVDGGTAPSTDTAPDIESETDVRPGDDVWSAVLFRLGFSFFVGFSLGYAVRMFFKFTVVGIGMMLFMLFGLEYAGLIEVHWAAFEGRFDSIAPWIEEQAGGFRAFVTGQLPAAGTALAGLVVGWMRR